MTKKEQETISPYSIQDVPQIDRTQPLLQNVMAAAPQYIIAIRRISIMNLETNRVMAYEEELSLPTQTAMRLDWFVNRVHRTHWLPVEAVALAFLATEVWDGNDGVNDSWFINTGWNGQGGGDYRVVNGQQVLVKQEKTNE
jgi:hypothetical protein